MPHNVFGVGHRGGLVKPLSESFSDKSSQTGVMSACSGMNLVE
jgi:hypothetical protein